MKIKNCFRSLQFTLIEVPFTYGIDILVKRYYYKILHQPKLHSIINGTKTIIVTVCRKGGVF